MSERDRLEASYRRWLRAYPRFYRRHRGLEILTTMLEAAEPGQVRATRGEAIHLVLSGLRCRLVPPGWAGKLAACLVTLWSAVVLSGVGAFVVWSPQASGLPDPSNLDDAFAGQPVSSFRSPGDGGVLNMAYTYTSWGELQTLADEGWDGERPVPSNYERVFQETGAPESFLADAEARLRAKGWRTGTVTLVEKCVCSVFWASRDGVLLRVSSGDAGSGQATILVSAHRAEPRGVPVGAIAGFAAGLLLAWPAMTWLAHRFARTPAGDRILIVLFGLPVLYACLANTVDNVLSMMPDPAGGQVLLAADLMYPLANQVNDPLAATVIVLGLAASVAITAFTPWQRRRIGAVQDG